LHYISFPLVIIRASNLFELAVAAAINFFGFNSCVALATAVGALIQMPAMLLVVSQHFQVLV